MGPFTTFHCSAPLTWAHQIHNGFIVEEPGLAPHMLRLTLVLPAEIWPAFDFSFACADTAISTVGKLLYNSIQSAILRDLIGQFSQLN
jgi:hypothetical protein